MASFRETFSGFTVCTTIFLRITRQNTGQVLSNLVPRAFPCPLPILQRKNHGNEARSCRLFLGFLSDRAIIWEPGSWVSSTLRETERTLLRLAVVCVLLFSMTKIESIAKFCRRKYKNNVSREVIFAVF